jgi:DNA repair protein RadD
MIPRDYQWESVVSFWKFFETNPTGNPVAVLPTGTGKSGVIAFFCRTVLEMYPTQKILVVTHVKELIEQNHKTMLRVWPNAPAGIYSSGLNRRDVYNNIIFAGVASIAKRAEEFGRVDLVIVDEAHLVSPNENTMYRKLFDSLKAVNPYVRVLGLTATPYRVGQGMVTEGENALFTDICIDLSSMERFNWFIDQGYLCPLIPKRTETVIDLEGVGTSGGDFVQKQLQNAIDKNEITERAIREVVETCTERKSWLVFASGIEHAVHIQQMLEYFGVSSAVVHSGNKEHKMTDGERDQIISDFKNLKFTALVNNGVLTTGFDHPKLDLIVNLKPTKSPGLWVQILGRGTRPDYAPGFDLTTKEGRLAAIQASEKRNCLVMDFGGNTKRIGPINDPNIPKAKGKKGGEAIVKECEAVDRATGKACKTLNHPSVKFCICCGAEFKFECKIKQSAGTDEIIKADLPVVEEFKVDHITYGIHEKAGKPPTLKVSYYCGFKLFVEWVCVEHTGFANVKAQRWWKERTATPIPERTLQALELTHLLAPATSLRVWVNKEYPEIKAYCFDGSHFGKEAVGSNQVSKVDTNLPAVMPVVKLSERDLKTLAEYGDDIPF